MNSVHFRDPDEAFNHAIEVGRLSDDLNAENWAGHWMYMYSKEGADYFKNIMTRCYITVGNAIP